MRDLRPEQGEQISARDRILGMARAARAEAQRKPDEAMRKRTVSGLMALRFELTPPMPQLTSDASEDALKALRLRSEALKGAVAASEAEIFEAAYGDQSGRIFWQAWLDDKPTDNNPKDETKAAKQVADATARLARALAAHSACDADAFESDARKIVEALRDIAEADPRLAVERMLKNSNTRHLVPPSLQSFLEPPQPQQIEAPAGAPEKPFPKSREKELRNFLIEGKHPNEETALAAAEKHFGCTINREYFREIRRGAGLRGKVGKPRKTR